MSHSMEKRNSRIYRKKLNLEPTDYFRNQKEIQNSRYKDNHQKTITNDFFQNYNNNTINPRINKNNNISLTYRDFPFYQINNKDNHPTFKRTMNNNIQEKIILDIFRPNNTNYLTESNKLNTESNYADNYYETLINFNKTYEQNDLARKVNTHESMNSYDLLSRRIGRNNANDSFMNNNLNNSVFIRKRTKDSCLRNNSVRHRKKYDLSLSNVHNMNQTKEIYIPKPELKVIKNENNRTINNSNININISINNNYLTDENNNKNIINKKNYELTKAKQKCNNIKMIIMKNRNKKSFKDSFEKTKIGESTYNKINERKINKINNNIENIANTKLYNLEDFLLIIQKFEMIKDNFKYLNKNINKFNSKQLLEYINKIRIKIFDIYKFYMSCSIEGSPENLFSTVISKNCLHFYSVILLISIGLCYVITQKLKTTIDYHGKILILLNLQEKAFLIFCDAIIKKLNKNYHTNVWVIEIIKKLNSQLISNADTMNHILQIRTLSIDSYKIINDILINIYIFDEKMKSNEQEIFLYNHYYKKDFNYLTHFNIYELEEIFDKNIFKAVNLRSNYANITSLKSSAKDNKDYLNRTYKKQYTKSSVSKKHEKTSYLNFPPKKEYTLVLDLDETLISFKFTQMNKGIGKLHLRPGLEDFLEEIKKYYEIIIFTSGTKDYADTILSIIEQKNNSKYFNGILYREHTTLIGKKYIKDLTKIGRDLSKTIIVDNLPQSFKLQRENGILINSFYGDNMDDRALYELKRILINIYNEKTDVRDSIIKYKEDIIKNVTCIDENVGRPKYRKK